MSFTYMTAAEIEFSSLNAGYLSLVLLKPVSTAPVLPSISLSLLVQFMYFKWENPLLQRRSNAETLSSKASGEIMRAQNISSGNRSYNTNRCWSDMLSFIQVSEPWYPFTEVLFA